MSANQQRGNAVLPYLVCSYTQELSTEMTNEIVKTVCRTLLDRLSPEGWVAAGQFIADSLTGGDLPSLVLYDPDVLDLGAADQSILRQCLAFFGKRKDIDIGVDREAAARRKFREAEAACQLTNDCFRAWSQGRFQFPPFVEAVLHRSQRKISDLLEQSGLLDLSMRDVRPRFGPGASTQVPKKNACPAVKLEAVPACSTNLAEHASALLSTWGAAPLLDEITEVDVSVHLGKLSFVPKNAKTDRAICTEPQLNGAYQLGVGDLLAKALRGVGIDIQDQSANQRAAMYGSISGALATLDLSSASDTVSTGLVAHLFPEQWVDLLMTLRTSEIISDGDVAPIRLSKISSMGNGFTFPLETIIFWAISSSVVEVLRCDRQRVRVYGDDIIVDTAAAEPLIGVLRSLGFTPNPTKSFWKGSFRESCGADYVFGSDVRPVFLDGPLTGADFFRLHNFFNARHDWEVARLFEGWIHPSIRTRGPKGYGDGHLHSLVWVSRPVRKFVDGEDAGWLGFHFETWTQSVRHLKRELRKQYIEREKGGTILYREAAAPLVRALATYVAQVREDQPRYDPSELRPNLPADRRKWLRDFAMQFKAREVKDLDHWVTPGEGVCRRTKIYTFETALA